MTSNQPPEDEFYIGYAPIPRRVKKLLWQFIPSLLLGLIIFALIIPLVHNQFTPTRVGGLVEYEGVLLSQPVPHLVVPRGGDTSLGNAYSRYPLSARNKKSVSPAILEQTGKWVKLEGSPVHRDHQTLISTKSATPIEPQPQSRVIIPEGRTLGQFSLTGVIADSKCYLGSMKPGLGKTHRECAIRCISGGVPPMFVSKNESGDRLYFFLVDAQGGQVNDRLLDLVADPVQITGEVVSYDDLLILKADPKTYELL